MHLKTLTLLSLPSLGLASASSQSCTPVPSASQGFRLVANVSSSLSDPSTPFAKSINGQYLSLAHIGPAQNRAILVSPSSSSSGPAPIFYQNGTYADFSLQRTSILTDAGTPLFPEGLAYQSLPDDSKGAGLFAFGGSGSGGIRLTRLWNPLSYLQILGDVVSSTLVVCNDTIPYYGNERFFNVVNWVAATRDNTGSHIKVPAGCVGINLVPECAFLEELPEGSISSHEFAQEVRCYNKVSEVEW